MDDGNAFPLEHFLAYCHYLTYHDTATILWHYNRETCSRYLDWFADYSWIRTSWEIFTITEDLLLDGMYLALCVIITALISASQEQSQDNLGYTLM